MTVLLLLLVSIGPLLVSPWAYDRAILIKESFFLLLSGWLFILFWLRVAAGPDLSLHIRATPLGKPILVLLAFATLSLLRAVNLPAALYRLGLLLAGLCVFYIVTHAHLDQGRIRACAVATIASALIATFYAFLQYVGLDPFRLIVLSSTLGNPNFFGEYVSSIIPICLALALASERVRSRQFYGLSALVLFAGLLLSRARAATLALVASLVVFGLLLRRRRMGHEMADFRRLLPLAGIALVIAGFFGFRFFSSFVGMGGIKGVLERYFASGSIQTSIIHRLVFYWDSLKMALDNHVLGVGIGNFEFAYPKYRSMPETVDPHDLVLDHAHNDYLELWAEVGVVGLVAFLWLLVGFFRKVFRSKEPSILSFGYAASVGSIAMNSLFSFGFYNPVPLAIFWLSMGFALRLQGGTLVSQDQGDELTAIERPPLWAVFVAMLAAVVLLYVSVRPLVGDTYLSRGYDLLAKGQVRQAVPFLEKAARLAPARVEAQGNLAQAYFFSGWQREAVAVLDRYLKHDPLNFRIHYHVGLYLEQMGEWDKALRSYEMARQAYPLFSSPLLRVGMIRERRGDLEGAMGAYREAIRLNPAFAAAVNNLATLLSAQEKLDEAIQVWEEGAKRRPDDPIIAQNLAVAYRKKSDYERALSWAARAEQLQAKERR